MDRKGIFSIITAFFIVIIIIFTLIGFFSLYNTVIKINRGTGQNIGAMTNAKLFVDRLLLCHEKNFLSEEKMDNNTCVNLAGIKGYKIMQQTYYNCEPKIWQYGDTDEENTLSKYVYWVSVQQNDSRKCLAKLFVYS